MSGSCAIEMKSVTLQLEGKVLLQDFNLRIKPGQKILVSGASGCGKSSLLKCLLGLIQPATGHVEVEGQAVSELSVWTLRQRMGYVAQEPELGDATVQEALEQAFTYKANRELKPRPESIGSWLERLLLPPAILQKAVSQLSGGEKQRVALIAALLLQRPILLLDEVTSALDPDSRQTVAQVLAEQTEQTLLMISHDPSHFTFVDQTLAWPGMEGRA